MKKYTIILEFRTKEGLPLEEVWEFGQQLSEFLLHLLKDKKRIDTIVSPTVKLLKGNINDHE